MLKEQAISLLTQVKEIILDSESWLDSTHQPIEEAFNMAIEAIKSTQTNAPKVLNVLDTISRQAAINAAKEELDNGTFYDIPSKIESLPSAQPEPEPVGCSGCRYERFGNRVCDVCSKFYADRYEAERRSDE